MGRLDCTIMSWQTLLHDLRPEILLRLGLALLAGLVVGIERESHGRAAGLRTTLLVCLSACVAMIVSDSFYQESFRAQNGAATWHPDPARLAAGILAGMGFLGAGVIVHERDHIVRGVTTAATLWFAAIIGLALGAGSVGIGVVSTLMALFILGIIPRFENRMENDWYSDLGIDLDTTDFSIEAVYRILESHHVSIKGVSWEEDIGEEKRSVIFHVKYKKGERLTLPAEIVKALRGLPAVRRVHWRG
jgi:putative Mg2+ transporter-C (MgtC) family protein